MQQNSYIMQDDLTFHRLTVFIGNVCELLANTVAHYEIYCIELLNLTCIWPSLRHCHPRLHIHCVSN